PGLVHLRKSASHHQLRRGHKTRKGRCWSCYQADAHDDQDHDLALVAHDQADRPTITPPHQPATISKSIPSPGVQNRGHPLPALPLTPRGYISIPKNCARIHVSQVFCRTDNPHRVPTRGSNECKDHQTPYTNQLSRNPQPYKSKFQRIIGIEGEPCKPCEN